ncbi:MAG: efflux RND transporter periplasmic adaptor subunit [Gammaproteobacteria bacterium]|nr:efflux RND transporter periplasmic adaptor subunit [Gammaproteobacteria bacterium]
MKSRKWWLFASLFIFVLVVIIIDEMEDSAEIEQKQPVQYRPPISIVKPQPQDNSGTIQTYAEISPRWATTLKAQVSGEVEMVFDGSFAGKQVKKGELLIRIEASRYRADLHEAEQALAEAKLNWLQAQKKSSQDKKNWQRSGIGGTPSDLVLNIPQLTVAEKTLNAAESRVAATQKMLSYTQIKAPFSGIITRRDISIGQTILEGDELLRIIENKQQEIAIALSRKQWGMLVKEWKNQTASIRNTDNVEIAQAHIKRGGGFVDAETRQYKLFLEILDTPDRASLVGDFVQVNLPSRIAHNSLAIPESALTRGGYIWYLDDKDQLRRFSAEVLFHRGNQVIIETPSTEMLTKHHPSQWRIATTPLASFLVGRHVDPITVKE